MIKATVNSFAGNEFKVSKPVYIWFGFSHVDTENVGVLLTFHNSILDAQTNGIKQTDKALQAMVGIQAELTLKIADLGVFSDFETLKDNIQAKLVEGLQLTKVAEPAKLAHVDSFEIV
jgi:hypothetical protein